MHSIPLIQVTLLCLAVVGHAALQRKGPPMSPYRPAKSLQAASNSIAGRELIKQCKVFYRNATLDHFSWVSPYHAV